MNFACMCVTNKSLFSIRKYIMCLTIHTFLSIHLNLCVSLLLLWFVNFMSLVFFFSFFINYCFPFIKLN